MSETAARQMHLFGQIRQGSHQVGWRLPEAAGKRDFSLYKRLALACEAAKFDAIFFADSLGFRPTRGQDAFSRAGATRLEPITLLSALAATTDRLGLVATASILNQPYTLARQFASLDHISNGRAGWNIVTSSYEHEAHNFGMEKNYPHDERYVRAEEFLNLAIGLWDGIEDTAVVADKVTGQYIDPEKVHGIGFKGKYYNAAGPIDMPRCPQGHPILVQAGASDAGRNFATRYADCLFTMTKSYDGAQLFYKQIKEQVAGWGRREDNIKILNSARFLIGSTEVEARRKADELDELINSTDAVRALEFWIGGFDLSPYDLDGPLPDLPETDRIQTTQAQLLALARRDGLTIRQLAVKIANESLGISVIGTPEQAADTMEAWFINRAVDGFVISGAYLPQQFELFTEHVVPILQKRNLFRSEYAGPMLRDHLGLSRPDDSFVLHPQRHAVPEIWTT
jgi:FMN-dependent oxidoreductase (nitrilotriacetate monooxygenase family)